ncbi:MAG: DUF167 domain-containing protein [Gammaproteobacteria bacterium]
MNPDARASVLQRTEDGAWQARLEAPPVDGKANAELIRLVSKHFGCLRSAVSIKCGASSRLELLEIDAD